VIEKHCTHCGGTVLRLGRLEGTGSNAEAETRWLEGPFQSGSYGGTRRSRKAAVDVDAYRCVACDHLELFVRND